MAGEPEPQWPKEALGAIVHEIVGWLRALWAVARTPRRFVADWAEGRTRPLNPLAYSLNGLAVAGPITAIIVHLLHIDDDALPLWAQLLKPVFPWAYNLIWLVPVHYGLRLFGSTRKLRTSVGASFYAGGPVHLARLLVVPLQLDQMAHPHDFRLAIYSGIGGLVTMILFCFYMTATMAGAHRLRAGRTALVVIVVFVISASFWGWFGIHSGRAGLRVIRALIT
ncbi:MAG: hypothetical protein ACXVDD_11810 [Polyangia bacterium]